MKNVAIGKHGKVISFNPEKWTVKGGDPEGSQLILNLAQLHPDWTIYIISKSDFCKWQHKNKFPNVIDVWEDYPGEEFMQPHKWPMEYVKKYSIQFDFALVYAGAVERATIPDFLRCVKPPFEYAKLTTHARKYAGPLIHFLNETQVPYFELGEDVRYLPCSAHDLYNRPKLVLTSQDWKFSQTYLDIVHQRETGRTDWMVSDGVEGKNVNHDLWFLANEEFPKYDEDLKRPIMMSIFSNYSGNKQFDKEAIIQKYVWNNFPYVRVYGDWADEYAQKYPDSVFPTPIYKMNDLMYQTKFTIMLAGVKVKGGGVWRSASKFWKMLMFGIVPFFLPGDDDDRLFGAPEYLYVGSPSDLYNKINELEKDEQLYLKIKRELFDLLLQAKDEGWFNGTMLDSIIIENLNAIYNLGLEVGTGQIKFKQSAIISDTKIVSTKKLF